MCAAIAGVGSDRNPPRSSSAALRHRQVPHEEVPLCSTHPIEERAWVVEKPEMAALDL